MELMQEIFGEGKDLNSLQMGCRAVVMFVIALVLLRIAGLKTFGKSSAFDNILVIMLGSMLSRGVAGVSPFFAVVSAGFAMVLMTRLVSYLAIKSKGFGVLVKGEVTSLYKDGKMNERNLIKCTLSESDVMQSVRKETNRNNLNGVEEVFLERSGEMSVIKKEE